MNNEKMAELLAPLVFICNVLSICLEMSRLKSVIAPDGTVASKAVVASLFLSSINLIISRYSYVTTCRA